MISPLQEYELLKRARETYGDFNQILVTIEELNELACVLAKFPRYEDKDKAIEALQSKVLDEYADVMIVLNHVSQIFKLSDVMVEERMDAKLERLKRWLETNNSFEQTTKDRTVEELPDSGYYRINTSEG